MDKAEIIKKIETLATKTRDEKLKLEALTLLLSLSKDWRRASRRMLRLLLRNTSFSDYYGNSHSATFGFRLKLFNPTFSEKMWEYWAMDKSPMSVRA